MGRKAPFWIYVEELADKLKRGSKPLSFTEIKQIAARDWPTLTDDQRERYKTLARQDKIAVPVIRYEPPPPGATTVQSAPEVPDYSHVMSKYFTLVDSPTDITLSTGGEIALAGFSLRDGVSRFLSAHLLPSSARDTETVRRQLRLPIMQQSSIVVSSSSGVLAEISQFCSCEQCVAGKVVLFANRSKVETLRRIFRDMISEHEDSRLCVIIEPIEKLIGVIHVALAHQTDQVDLNEVSRASEEISRRSAVYAKVPCSRHRPTDVACAHGGVSALAFSFIKAFIVDLNQLGVDTNSGRHFLQPISPQKQSNGSRRETPHEKQTSKNEPTSANPMAVVPGPVVFVPGKGRLRTVAKIVPWKEWENASGRETRAS